MTNATLSPTIYFANPPKNLPFLKAVCWQAADVHHFTPEDMLSRYERGWRYRNIFNNLEGEELHFLKELAKHHKSWLLSDL